MDAHVSWPLPLHRQSNRWVLLRLVRTRQDLRVKGRLGRERRWQRVAVAQVHLLLGVKAEVLTKVAGVANQAWNEVVVTRDLGEDVVEVWHHLAHKGQWGVLLVV